MSKGQHNKNTDEQKSQDVLDEVREEESRKKTQEQETSDDKTSDRDEQNNGKNEGKSAKGKSTKDKNKEKIEKLEKKINDLEKEKSDLKDQALRKMAEFENLKRRKEKEFLEHIEFANENLIKELLPILDDFERFLSHANQSDENEDTNESLRKGMELIYKNLMSVLTKQGLKPIESVGKEFDADLHDALMQMESEEHDSGYVIEEHVKGYMLNDKVIRHAKVLVSK